MQEGLRPVAMSRVGLNGGKWCSILQVEMKEDRASAACLQEMLPSDKAMYRQWTMLEHSRGQRVFMIPKSSNKNLDILIPASKMTFVRRHGILYLVSCIFPVMNGVFPHEV